MVQKELKKDSEKKYVNNNEKSEKVEIFIKKEAFRNMLTHVLRFGNDALEKSIEVMGICTGKYNDADDKVIIDNAIPVIHGDKVEIGFDKDIYELFEQMKKKYSSDLVGYYHSHPSWGLYLSESDLKNIQYFQREEFPYGFAIVFDHTLMNKNGNFGFDIFRLDDYSKTDNYHSVSFEIEIPSFLEYFKWVQKFMEDFQKISPVLIKEINESVESIPDILEEIPISEEAPVVDKKGELYPQLTPIISGIQQGVEKFSSVFTDIIETQLEPCVIEINQGTTKGSEYISKTVNKMKEAINSGILKADNWFKRTLNETVNDFKRKVSKSVDERVESNKILLKEISNIKNDVINNLPKFIEDSLKNINNETETLLSSIEKNLQENTETSLKIEEIIENNQSTIRNLDTQVREFSQDIEKKVEKSVVQLEKNINEKIEKLSTELESFKEYNSEIKILLDRLQKIITGFRNLS